MEGLKALEELQFEWEFNNKELPRGFVDTRVDIIEQELEENQVNKNKITQIIEILVDWSKGNYANDKTVLLEIREVLNNE